MSEENTDNLKIMSTEEFKKTVDINADGEIDKTEAPKFVNLVFEEMGKVSAIAQNRILQENSRQQYSAEDLKGIAEFSGNFIKGEICDSKSGSISFIMEAAKKLGLKISNDVATEAMGRACDLTPQDTPAPKIQDEGLRHK